MINLLYIGKDQYWAGVLAEALEDLAVVNTVSSPDELTEQGQVDLIILDALQIEELGGLVQKGYYQKVVVATAAPDWRYAREVFLGGALDYIVKVINVPDLRRKFDEILSIAASRMRGRP